MDLPLLSALIVASALALYVVLDGFDLGVGALLLVQRDERIRDRMVDAIMPTWDGNETWLIMAGVALLAAFPLAYGTLLPAFYLPLIIMLLSLGLRGVSFEFRYQATRARRLWDLAFGLGSITAALMQGVIVGGLVQGITTTDGQFSGSVCDTFTPFSALTAVALLSAYAVVGAGWLHLKGADDVRAFAVRVLRKTLPALVALAVVVCAAAASLQPGIRSAWQTHGFVLWTISGLFLVTAGMLLRAAGATSDVRPFALGVCLLALAVVGMAIAFFPNIVPFRLSLWAAASSTRARSSRWWARRSSRRSCWATRLSPIAYSAARRPRRGGKHELESQTTPLVLRPASVFGGGAPRLHARAEGAPEALGLSRALSA